MMLLLHRYMQENGFRTIQAQNAELGLEKYHQETPDLVLMDLMLPGMSGQEAINKIREEQHPNTYTPIIIITAKNAIEDIVRGLESGADDYVVKPFHFSELLARVKTALRLKELNEMLVQQSNQLEEANSEIRSLNKTLLSKNKELRKSVYNLHSLFEISMDLNSILELDKLVNSILLTLAGQFSCNKLIFMLARKHDISRLEIVNSKGFHKDDLKDLLVTRKDPLIGFFTKKPRPASLKEIGTRAKNSIALREFKKLKIQILSPVIVQQSVIGLICMGPRVKNKAYAKQDLEQISTLGNIISISISNASLYQEVEQLSYMDGMTELHNYRYFELRLKEEVLRHKRTNQGLSLLILDVDNFKNYNDTLGHPAGDEVLRKLGKILKTALRENDIVARYGGEEFAVILPAVDKKGAIILADRLRMTVEETYFDHEEIQPGGKVTVSIGSASMPEDALDHKELINKADIALYSAKRNGRNRVCDYDAKMEK